MKKINTSDPLFIIIIGVLLHIFALVLIVLTTPPYPDANIGGGIVFGIALIILVIGLIKAIIKWRGIKRIAALSALLTYFALYFSLYLNVSS